MTTVRRSERWPRGASHNNARRYKARSVSTIVRSVLAISVITTIVAFLLVHLGPMSSLMWASLDVQLQRIPHEKSFLAAAVPNDVVHVNFPTVIFYHIYVPDDSPYNVKRIIGEQLGHIGTSYALQRATQQNSSLEVQYVTIGYHSTIIRKFMSQRCSDFERLNCIHLKHLRDGAETVTLDEIRSFCQRYPAQTVTYIHSKGSFHTHDINEHWRPILTQSALSVHCINGVADGSCNLCGLQFFAQWTSFIPGNMWTAKCSYIQNLLPLEEFGTRLEKVAKKVLQMRLRGQILTNTLPDRKDFFGLERYASEHWVASHPRVKPCDCDSKGDISRFIHRRTLLSGLSFGLAPRHRGVPTPIPGYLETDLVALYQTKDLRVREYFWLPGNLLKWYSLYGEAPDNSSWAWTWFPDGDFWQEQTRQWGADAVDIVTRKYTGELLAGPGAFVDEGGPRAVLSFAETLSKSWAHAIFYDLRVSQDADNLTYLAELDFAAAQVKLVESQLPDHGRHSSLFYRTMGNKLLHDVDLCRNTSMLECRRLGHEDAFYAGEILLDVHAFCERYSNSLVSLIHNIPPRDIDGETPERKHRFLRHATMASISNECLVIYGEKCNLCGLAFFTEPKMAMAGNMWTASCSYINRLHSPVLFQEKMGHFIEDVLVMKVSEKLEMGLYAPRVDVLGLDKFAVEHWVGSHPSLLPCDVSLEKFGYWLESEPRAHDHSLKLGPRHRGSPFSYNRTREAEILDTIDRRGREFSFLPGQLEKWYHLYGETPNNSSWVWSWFPDGGMWLSEVSGHGKEAVNIVTEAFVPKGPV